VVGGLLTRIRRLTRIPRLGRLPAFVLGVVTGVAVALTGVALTGVPHSGPGSAEDGWEPGEIVLVSGHDGSPGGQRQALIDIWNGQHPDHPARIEDLKEVADGERAEMLARAAAKATPDIFNLDIIYVAEFVERGYLRPIDESALPRTLRDGFLTKPLETCRYQGRLWGLPFHTNAGLLFYRSDLVPRPVPAGGSAGPRFDWAAIEAQSRLVPTLRTKEPRLSAGYTGQLNPYEGLSVNAMEAIWAAGGDIVQDSRVTFDPARWQAGLARLAVEPDRGAGVLLNDSLAYDEALSRDAFATGRTLFMRNWPQEYRNLATPDPGGRAPTIRFDVARLPGPSALGGQNLAIARNSPRPRAAQALIQFLTSEPSQRQLFERGGFVATQKAVYGNPAVQKDNPYVSLVRQAIDEANTRPVTPYYAKFTKEFQDGVQYALQHGGAVPDGFPQRLTDALHGR
jgi:multiple sugar transport system substrate-binding protein